MSSIFSLPPPRTAFLQVLPYTDSPPGRPPPISTSGYSPCEDRDVGGSYASTSVFPPQTFPSTGNLSEH